MNSVTSLQGPVETVDGKLTLLIPLIAGGSELIQCSRGIAEVEGEYLKVTILDWLAGKLGIRHGSLVSVSNQDGKFHIRLIYQFLDFSLAQRLEAMEACACRDTACTVRKLHPEIAAAEESISGGWAIFTGVGSPISEARGLGMSGPVTEDDMDRLEAFYHSRGDAIRIEVCPLADTSLHQSLAKRGYRLAEFSNMLMRPIDPGEQFASNHPGVATRPVEPSEGLLWAETVGRGFAEHFPLTDELVDIMSCWAHSTIAACYLGTVEGAVAGGAALAIHDGVALFGGAATLSAFRNRGLQSALLEARLAHAAAARCDLAMTVTLPGSGSQRNCERQGFRVVYTRAKFTLP